MAQHDYVIANGTGAAVRSDLNNALAAIVSQNSGATEPTTTYAYMPWADTGSSPPVFKIRNAANNGWITLYELDGTFSVEAGSASSPGLYFTGDINTGIFSAGADQFNIATNGVERVEWGTTEVVFNDGGANYDFRIEGDTNSSLFFVDASAEAVGIGTTSPTRLFHANDSASEIVGRISSGQSSSWLQFAASGNGTASRVGSPDGGATASLAFMTNDTERGRWDSSGRFLVGTSSSPSAGQGQYGLLVVQGYAGSSTGEGIVSIQRGAAAASIASGGDLGRILFGDNAGNTFAGIYAFADATPGSGDYPGRLSFSTTKDGASSPTTRFNISNEGIAAVVSENDALNLTTTAAGGTVKVLVKGFHSGTAGSIYSGTMSLQIYNNGNILNTNNSYAGLSDIKLKENVVDAGSQWDDLKALRVVNYNFKPETRQETHKQLGLIAQEVELVSPGLVSESPDRDQDGNDLGTVTKSVNYSVLYMKAVKALQEAMERIETLEAEVAALKA